MSLPCCLWDQKTPVLCLFKGERFFAAAPTTIALRRTAHTATAPLALAACRRVQVGWQVQCFSELARWDAARSAISAATRALLCACSKLLGSIAATSPPCYSAFTAMLLRSHGRTVSDCCRPLLLNRDHWCLKSSPAAGPALVWAPWPTQPATREPEPLLAFAQLFSLLFRKIESLLFP